jgi:hypothetical protein
MEAQQVISHPAMAFMFDRCCHESFRPQDCFSLRRANTCFNLVDADLSMYAE